MVIVSERNFDRVDWDVRICSLIRGGRWKGQRRQAGKTAVRLRSIACQQTCRLINVIGRSAREECLELQSRVKNAWLSMNGRSATNSVTEHAALLSRCQLHADILLHSERSATFLFGLVHQLIRLVDQPIYIEDIAFGGLIEDTTNAQ